MSEVGEETIIDYTVDSNLTGKLGSLGQPVLRSKAKEMERQFAARLQAAFAARARGSYIVAPSTQGANSWSPRP